MLAQLKVIARNLEAARNKAYALVPEISTTRGRAVLPSGGWSKEKNLAEYCRAVCSDIVSAIEAREARSVARDRDDRPLDPNRRFA